ncbi:putative DNA oxidative demethylase [Helianthus anomalus]
MLLSSFLPKFILFSNFSRFYTAPGSIPPPVPPVFIPLVQSLIQDAQAHLTSANEIPLMHPDVCLVNFYTATSRLGLHQDRDERPYSIRGGLPVVSISIGDVGEFLYGHTRDEDKLQKVVLESGDVVIFGGKSRLIFHGVRGIFPNSTPLPLLEKIMLRPGRLTLLLDNFEPTRFARSHLIFAVNSRVANLVKDFLDLKMLLNILYVRTWYIYRAHVNNFNIRLSVVERSRMLFLNIKPHGAPEHYYRGRYGDGKSWSRDRHSGVNICTIFPPTRTYIYIYIHTYLCIIKGVI